MTKIFFRRLAVAQLFWLVAAMLSACGGGTISLTNAWDQQQPTVRQYRTNFGHMELMLDPVNVWEDKNASAPVNIEIDGHNLFVRKYGGDMFAKAWVQVGLFWHSENKNIMMPVVVFDDTVKIAQVDIKTSHQQASLPLAKDFEFTPGKSGWAPRPSSSAVFVLPPQLLEAMVKEQTAQLIIKTARGNLHVGVDVVRGDAEAEVRRNARYLFARFADKMRDVQNG